MNYILQPWQLFLFILVGWIHRQQQQANEYLRTENQVLKEKLGKKRILLNDDQRRRLAVKGKVLGRKALQQVATIVTPDTILRWHRKLVASKWDYSHRRKKKPGRPPLSDEIKQFVVRIARQNPTWGYDKIAGAAQNVGHTICDESVRSILKAHGIEPAPDRKQTTTWKTFLKAHWDVLASIDFTTIEIWTKGGLVTFYLLFAMELKTRRVHFAGYSTTPNEAWMKQTARELTNCEDGFLNSKRYLLMDRDGKFCPSFRGLLQGEDVEPVTLPPRSPNLNAHLERFFGSLKSECLNRLVLFGEKAMRNAIHEYLAHYHCERNHQGLANEIIDPGDEVGSTDGEVRCRERLGGLLNYYYRNAA